MTIAVLTTRPRRWPPFERALAFVGRHRDTLVSMIDQALVSGFGFAVGIGAARVIGIEEFGRFAIALIFAAFFQAIHSALFVIPMMSLAGLRANRSRAYYAAVLLMAGTFALAGGGLVALALAAFFGMRDGTLLVQFAIAGGLLTAVQCVQLTMRRAFFAQGRGGFAFAMDGLRAVVFVLGLTGLIVTGTETDAVHMLWVLGASSAAVVAGFALALRSASGGRRMMRAVAGRHWAVARWLVGVPIVSMGQDTVEWIFAGLLFGDMAVGGLRATQYLFGPVLVLMAAIENVVPVRAASAFASGGVPELRVFLWRAGLALGLAVAGLLVVAVAPAEYWLGFLFGPNYASFHVVALVFGFATGAIAARDYLTQYFRAVQKTEAIFYSFVVGAVVVLALLYPLSIRFGLIGLAAATVIGQGASLAYLLVAILRHYRAERDP